LLPTVSPSCAPAYRLSVIGAGLIAGRMSEALDQARHVRHEAEPGNERNDDERYDKGKQPRTQGPWYGTITTMKPLRITSHISIHGPDPRQQWPAMSMEFAVASSVDLAKAEARRTGQISPKRIRRHLYVQSISRPLLVPPTERDFRRTKLQDPVSIASMNKLLTVPSQCRRFSLPCGQPPHDRHQSGRGNERQKDGCRAD